MEMFFNIPAPPCYWLFTLSLQSQVCISHTYSSSQLALGTSYGLSSLRWLRGLTLDSPISKRTSRDRCLAQ